jgi:hypothetical protein
VDFISRVENDTDRKILCQIAYIKELLWSENIPALIKGSGLKETDFTFNKQADIDKITADRLVDPWDLAVAGRKGKKGKEDISFDDLDFEDEGTILKGIARSINTLNVFKASQKADKPTIALLTNLQKSDLKPLLDALYTKVSAEKEPSAELIKGVEALLSQVKSLNEPLDEKWNGWSKKHKTASEETPSAGGETTRPAEHKNMTAVEKERKEKCYEFLKANNMDTSENRAKIEAVKFTSNSIEI